MALRYYDTFRRIFLNNEGEIFAEFGSIESPITVADTGQAWSFRAAATSVWEAITGSVAQKKTAPGYDYATCAASSADGTLTVQLAQQGDYNGIAFRKKADESHLAFYTWGSGDAVHRTGDIASITDLGVISTLATFIDFTDGVYSKVAGWEYRVVLSGTLITLQNRETAATGWATIGTHNSSINQAEVGMGIWAFYDATTNVPVNAYSKFASFRYNP